MLRLFLAFLVLNFFTIIACKGSYSINAPGTIRSNRKYTVCATLHNVSEAATLRIGVRSRSSWSNIQLVELQPYETKILDFYPPKLDSQKIYELFAEGVKGLNFHSSEAIQVGHGDAANIHIETDKGSYKPGDLLRFRIIILNEHAKPMTIFEPIKVQIFDASNIRVKQFKDIRLKKGFYTDEFQISKDPLLGDWSIKVFIVGKYALEKQAVFEVEKYILPKFRVVVEADDNFVEEDRYMNISVYGQYTYKKFVEGKVNLLIYQNYNTIFGNYTSEIVDFSAKFKIDIKDFSKMVENNKLLITASFTEKQTGVVQDKQTIIYLQQQRYKMTILDDEIELRNEIPFRIKVKIQYWNNTVVDDPETSVYMLHGQKRYEAKLDNNGLATFDYELEEGEAYEFRYKNSSQTLQSFASYLQSSILMKESSQCTLEIKTESPKLNSVIEIVIQSDQHIPYLVYTLTSHANIIRNELVHLDFNQNSYILKLKPSNEMVPTSFLYVHYVVDGNLVFCETKIILPDEFENTISIISPLDVQPGDDISIKIIAQPGSHVAITAVDASSLIYSSGNHINKRSILNMMRFDLSYVSGGSRKIPGYLSGLVTLTDAYFHKDELIQIFPGKSTKMSTDTVEEVIGSDLSYREVRSYFPETWMFSDFEITNPITTIKVKVPDSITTWILKGFSLNEETGLGVLDPVVEITAFKQFFLSTYLPYSIKLGEIVSIPVVIYNYHEEPLNTEVAMRNSLSEFKFVDARSNTTTNSVMENKIILVPAQSGKSVNFLIYPLKLGDIQIDVGVNNKLATDDVRQKLTVEPNGLATSHNSELYVTLEPEENFSTHFAANIPPNVATDSEFVQLSISGNVLLPLFDNLGDLVDKATGCGEQNMIHFAPNILVLEYISATRQTSKYRELAVKAKRYTEIGFQNQLKFRHRNGGYSVFGYRRSSKPSNWLTAYVVRFFVKALKYLPIEPEVIESSLNFLAHEQLSTGEFKNAGYLFHPAYQSRYGFTAFVLLSFLENPKYAKKHKVVIEKAIDFLSNSINEIDDTYSLAIMAAVFQMAKHEHASVILDKLRPMARIENGLQWWEDKTDDRVTDIEITSYILLALLEIPGQYLPIAKWLLEQRNSHGGFKSTQDTVVGLQALIKFSQLTSPQNDTLIKVFYRALSARREELESGVLGLDPESARTLQHQQLPPATRSVDIEITGTGSIFLQYSYQYRELLQKGRDIGNENQILPKSFRITTKPELTDNSLTMNLELCIQYRQLDDIKDLTNMIIAEIELPSGYVANEENIEHFKNGDLVDRIENERPDKLVLYFTYVEAGEEKCVNLIADKKDEVRNLKPSTIVVYEFYHSERREVVAYEIEYNEIM